MTTGEGGIRPRPHTGVLWRITRTATEEEEEDAP